jgi:hypothetical protein
MPLLFSYGTLREPDVQLSTFGRRLEGNEDVLVGFEPSRVEIEDPRVVAETGQTHYANVTFNGRPDSRVGGTVFEVTDVELMAADEYERSASYVRIATVLASGREAWLYVDKRSFPPKPG